MLSLLSLLEHFLLKTSDHMAAFTLVSKNRQQSLKKWWIWYQGTYRCAATNLSIDIGMLSMTDHPGTLLHVMLKVFLWGVEKSGDTGLEDTRKHLDLLGGCGNRGNFALKRTSECLRSRASCRSSNLKSRIWNKLDGEVKHQAIRVVFGQSVDERSPRWILD